MALKEFRPLTPTLRFKSLPAFDEITKWRPEKGLVSPKKKTGGRNNYGRVTSRHIGGGHKQKYRKVDFKRRKRGVSAEVQAIVEGIKAGGARQIHSAHCFRNRSAIDCYDADWLDLNTTYSDCLGVLARLRLDASRAWMPAPMIAATCASGRDRCFAATAPAAAVRTSVR